MPATDVLLVSHGFQKAYERGFSNALAANGVKPLLVASDETDFAQLDPRVETLNLRGSQSARRSRWRKLANLVRYHAKLLVLAVRQQRCHVHVIGLIEPQLLCGIFEGLAFRARRGRYLLTVHDLLPHDRHTALHRLLSRLSYRLPNQLIVHTRRMREELVRDFNVPPGKVIVMEHGIEPVPVAGQVTAPRRATTEPMRLLFFGVVAHYKGLDILLDALSAFPEAFSLLIAGKSIDEALTASLRARLSTHSASASIVWENDFIAEKRIQGLFNESDALVLPYRHIDQSGVLFQALRFGIPVVATRVGAFSDYVSPDIGELCEPTAASVASALLRLHARLPEMDREHIAAVGRSFEWSTTVKPVVNAYAA